MLRRVKWGGFLEVPNGPLLGFEFSVAGGPSAPKLRHPPLSVTLGRQVPYRPSSFAVCTYYIVDVAVE